MNGVLRLKRLTELRLQADQARLATVLSKEADLRQSLDQLAEQSKQRLDAAASGGDAASVASADLNWQLWIDQRRTTINTELARTLGEKVELTALLRKSFGQDQAAGQLCQASKAADRSAVARRASYES